MAVKYNSLGGILWHNLALLPIEILALMLRWVLERLMSHFCLLLSELMHVCLDPLWLWLGATEGVVGAEGVGVEGVGAMGAAGVEELPLALDLVLKLLGGRCECLLKVTSAVLMLSRFPEPLEKL